MADVVDGQVILPAHINALRSGADIAAAAIGATQLTTSAITLGYTEITSDFTTTTVGSDVDVTSLSVAVTVPTGGRRCKITAWVSGMMGSFAGTDLMQLAIKESSTVLSYAQAQTSGASVRQNMSCIYSSVLSSGSHTFKVAIQQNNAGTLTLFAGATYPAFILVEAI